MLIPGKIGHCDQQVAYWNAPKITLLSMWLQQCSHCSVTVGLWTWVHIFSGQKQQRAGLTNGL